MLVNVGRVLIEAKQDFYTLYHIKDFKKKTRLPRTINRCSHKKERNQSASIKWYYQARGKLTTHSLEEKFAI